MLLLGCYHCGHEFENPKYNDPWWYDDCMCPECQYWMLMEWDAFAPQDPANWEPADDQGVCYAERH